MAKENLIPRDQLTEEQLAEALLTCAAEPIHIPNLIQPHGAIVVLDGSTNVICQVSANIEAFIGKPPQSLLNQKVESIFADSEVDKINQAIRFHDLQPVKSVYLELGGKKFNAAVHLSEGFKIIELEFDSSKSDDNFSSYSDLADLVRDFAIDMHNSTNAQILYDLLVKNVRDLTNFDRVKLYRFDEEWNGAIVAEAKAEFMPSYLGLNFPASDIPEQARKLYSKSYLRLIPDISYKPIAMEPQLIASHGRPIDMSYAILRSVSPVHIQYLDNIGVKASMSISIMQNGKLWGLVACHHGSSHWIPYNTRVLAEAMGHIFSAKLSSIHAKDEQHKTKLKNLILEKMSLNLTSKSDISGILSENSAMALDALSAQGMVISSGNKNYQFGDTPNENITTALLEWCHMHMKGEIIYTRDAEQFLKSHNAFLNITGGFLAVPIGRLQNDVAIWFRNEKSREVFWAGNPEKPVEQTKAGYRLTPRASFDLWKTSTKGKSDEWSESDIAAAQSIAQIILENEKIYAERSSIAKTDFLSNMSHELRTPMSAVIGIVQILARDETLSPRNKQLISTLDVSASSLLNLINDLLDIAKIEANQIVLEEEKLDIGQLFGDVQTLMKQKAKEKNISLNINIEDTKEDITLLGDSLKLKQVLTNLVSNAVKFTDKGFVNFSFSLNRMDKDVAWATFEVADSGIGIPQNKVDVIFDKFSQADPSITRKFGGTGLGLSITKTIVMAMGGSIEVKSKEGLGSKFIVQIPFKTLKLPKNSTIPDMPAEPVYESDAKRILLVEDQENNILVANFFLDERGYNVTVAKNGQEALDIMGDEDFDLIIMDVQMPVMDGLTTTKIIREKEQRQNLKRVPIMAMTANALKEDRQICLDAGMDDYISKPIKIDVLNQKLDMLLGTD